MFIMCLYKKHACMPFFHLSGRIPYKWSINHTGFFFSPFFILLDQANSIPVQAKSCCLLKMEFFLVPLLFRGMPQRIDGFWDLVLSPSLFWYISISKPHCQIKGLYLVALALEVSPSLKKVKASYKK